MRVKYPASPEESASVTVKVAFNQDSTTYDATRRVPNVEFPKGVNFSVSVEHRDKHGNLLRKDRTVFGSDLRPIGGGSVEIERDPKPERKPKGKRTAKKETPVVEEPVVTELPTEEPADDMTPVEDEEVA